MSREYEISVYTIVLVGSFNPRIFTPSWFEKYDLLTEREAENADVKVIHEQISNFVADWLTLLVEPDRFAVSCTVPPLQLRDFVVKTFRDYLSHTPIHSMGINREVHYKLPSAEARFKMGRALAPIEPWGKWGKELDESEEGIPSGLMNITMRKLRPSKDLFGFTQITVQPSAKIQGLTGVFIQVNDHYQLPNRSNIMGSSEIMTVLEDRFDDSVRQSDTLIEQTLDPWDKTNAN